MKNTVFTVIAVLLLLATVQFAVGAIFTVVNYEDTEVQVSYAYKATNPDVHLAEGVPESARDYYRIQGWYTIERNKVARLEIEDTREVYLRIQRNENHVIEPGRWNNQERDTKDLLYHPWAKHDIREDGEGWGYPNVSGLTVMTTEQAGDELRRIAEGLNFEPKLSIRDEPPPGDGTREVVELTYSNLDREVRRLGITGDITRGLDDWAVIEGDKRITSWKLRYHVPGKAFEVIRGFIRNEFFPRGIRPAWSIEDYIYPENEPFRELSNAMLVHAINGRGDRAFVQIPEFSGRTEVRDPEPGSTPTDGLEVGTYWKINFDRGERVYNIGSPPVTIKGLPLTREPSLSSATLEHPVPDDGGNAFILFGQGNYNTCGPTSLQMILHYYGKSVAMSEIWDAGGINSVVVGTTPGEMERALNGLGVPCDWFDNEDSVVHEDLPVEERHKSLRRWIDESRPPCLLIKTPESFHYIVVVGYAKNKNGSYDYLIADPTGGLADPAGDKHGSLPHFRWESYAVLDGAWSWRRASSNLWNAFKAINVYAALDPYTAIVPRNGASASSFYEGLWTELKVHEEYGNIRPTAESNPVGWLIGAGAKLIGKDLELSTRRWDGYVKFHHPFDSYKASAVQLISSFTGTAKLTGVSKGGARRVDLRGKIEDGVVQRGRMWVFVRTYRSEASPAAPAAPSQVVFRRLPEPAAATSLLPNYPNPFNPETWIPYQLSEPAEVTVSIYSVDGRLVRTLELGQMPSGVYRSRSRAAYWDGRNARGESVASGIYFYTLRAGDFFATRKLVIRK